MRKPVGHIIPRPNRPARAKDPPGPSARAELRAERYGPRAGATHLIAAL
ncbi:hypothetical protein COLSTE_02033, partial [Collinsella stercoris DSM 13279]